jgi:hypothetical protein
VEGEANVQVIVFLPHRTLADAKAATIRKGLDKTYDNLKAEGKLGKWKEQAKVFNYLEVRDQSKGKAEILNNNKKSSWAFNRRR